MLGVRLQTAEIDGERWGEIVLTIQNPSTFPTVKYSANPQALLSAGLRMSVLYGFTTSS
jgi:hypothetical protein